MTSALLRLLIFFFLLILRYSRGSLCLKWARVISGACDLAKVSYPSTEGWCFIVGSATPKRAGHAASHGAVVRSSLFKVRPEALQAPRRARDAPPVVPPYLRSTRFQGGRRNPRPQGHDGDAVALRAPPRPGAPCGRSRPGVARPKARLPTVEQKRQLFLGPPAKSRGACRRRRRPRLTTCSLVREYRPGSLSGREGLGSPGRGRRLPADVRPTPGSSSGSGTRPAP
jgi:hypothetical protein